MIQFKSALNKGQAALEFILLVSFMFLIFVAFFGIIQNRFVDVSGEKARQGILDQQNALHSDVELAAVAEDNLQRVVSLPPTINGKEYNLLLRGIKQEETSIMELQFQYKDEPKYESSFVLPSNSDDSWIGPDLTTKEFFPGEKICLSKKRGKLYLEMKSSANCQLLP